jgi:mono/diheme cytochrome c family protein
VSGSWCIRMNGMFLKALLQKIRLDWSTRRAVAARIAFCLLPSALLLAQALKYPKPPDPGDGKQIFNNGCVACHGADGRGTPQTIAGFERPDTFPDFTKCDQTTPEPNSAWKDVIVHGGPSRGFSQIMPAFGELLTSEQIDDLIAYVRGFCTNKRWARGELNLPRALVTEKAYPEDEVVISAAVNARGAPGFTTNIIHEQRFGVHNQIEVDVPIIAQDLNHTWYGGVGDVTLGLKREFFSSLRTGSIFSLQGSVILPTGNRSRGFGTGTTTFETFAAFDQLFPTNTFVQFQAGADLPRHTNIAPQTVFWRAAVGQAFAQDHGLGRLWSPMVEFVADRDLVDGAKINWDIVPEMQVTISRRQHVRANLGLRTPASNTAGRPIQVLFYILWDWGDGKLTEGW